MLKKITGEELYRLNKTGQSYANIAQQYNLTRGTVAGMIDRHKKTLNQSEIPLGRKTEFVQSGNEAVAESVGRIKTLDQLIEACAIDLENWKIDRYTVNKWEVGRKASTKDLTYEDGIINGSVFDNGGINVEPLYQVKAWLSKINPEPIRPVLKPIYISVKSISTKQKHDRSLSAALIVPDTQFGFSRDIYSGKLTPFHDRFAINSVLKIAEKYNPETIVFLGDIVDWSGWSDKFIRLPEFYFTSQPALIEASWVMAQFRALTAGRVVVLEGNHDLRPEKMLINHLVDAYGLKAADQLDCTPVMSIDNLLGLSRMGIEYIRGYPDGETWINNNTKCIHGEKVRGQPGQTAAAVVRDANETVIFGHIHKYELASKTIRDRNRVRSITAYAPGCLCHIDGRVPGSNKSNNWQQGAAIVWYNDEESQIQHIDIKNGCAFYNGTIFEGIDYTDNLCKDTKWSF